MRKQILPVLLLAVALCGCAQNVGNTNTTNVSVEPEETSNATQVETPATNTQTQFIKVDTYENDVNNYDITKESYTFSIIDDKKAKLSFSQFSTFYDSTTNYYGSYETSGNITKFSYGEDGGYYLLKYEDEKIVGAVSEYESNSVKDSISGTYTAVDNYYGGIELTIEDYSFATLKTKRGLTFYGVVAIYSDNYDLMVASLDRSESIDWFITINDDGTFSYRPYGEDAYYDGEYSNVDFAGEYPMYGDFGGFSLYVQDDYSASAWIPINGNDIYFTGEVSLDNYTGLINWVYLNSDEDITLSLDLEYIESDQIWNYSGSITTPLSAG